MGVAELLMVVSLQPLLAWRLCVPIWLSNLISKVGQENGKGPCYQVCHY